MEYISPASGPYVLFQGKKWLDFSSCDFLGLSQHPEVKKRSIKYTLKYGVGVPTPPLRSAPQQELEEKLAHCLGAEAASLFPSLEDIYQILKHHKVIILSSESDDLEQLSDKKSVEGEVVCIDESFTIGVVGHNGFGVAAHKGGLSVGSLAFGAGCSGAYMAGPKHFVDQKIASQSIDFSRLGSINSALDLIPQMDYEREVIKKNHSWLQKYLHELALKKLRSPRVFFEFKSKKEAEFCWKLFAEDQIFLAPPEKNKLYIALTALHTPDDLDQLAISIKKLLATDFALSTQSPTPIP